MLLVVSSKTNLEVLVLGSGLVLVPSCGGRCFSCWSCCEGPSNIDTSSLNGHIIIVCVGCASQGSLINHSFDFLRLCFEVLKPQDFKL